MMIHTITRKYEIIMGHEGETGYRTVAFDVSMFPEDAVVFLDYVRYGEYVPYPINLERKGSVAYWYPNEIDTAFRGTGRGQLVCMRGDELIGKSDVFKLINRFSLSHDEEAPSGYENWLQELERIAASVVSGVDAGKAEIDAEIESGKAEINTAKTTALDRISTVLADGIDAVNEAKTQGVSAVEKSTTDGVNAVNSAKTDSLDAIERKKEAVHTELDVYVEAHHDELKGEKGDAYVVTEEDLKEIGDRVEAEYEPQLNALKSEVSAKAEATDLATANRKIKALTDVLNGKELAFEKNDYESAKVDVPSGAVADSILKIGGKSVVWNQLVDMQTGMTTGVYSGLNLNNDGLDLVINGTYTGATTNISSVRVKNNPNHKYFVQGRAVSGTVNGTIDFNTQSWGRDTTHNGIIITSTSSNEYWFYTLYVSNGAVANNLRFRMRIIDLTQMFGSGNEPTSVDDTRIKAIEEYAEAHPEYNGGELMSSQTDAVGVRGKNLVHLESGAKGIVNIVNDECNVTHTTSLQWSKPLGYIDFVAGQRYTFSVDTLAYGRVGLSKTSEIPSSITRPTLEYLNGSIVDSASLFPVGITTRTFVAKETVRANIYYCNDQNNSSGRNFTFRLQLEKGENQTPYKPYSYKEIPTNLPILRSAGSVHDSIEGGKLIRRVGVVDLGTLSWAYYNNTFYALVDNRKVGSHNMLTDRYIVGLNEGFNGNNGEITTASATAYIYIKDSAYTDATTFKNAMSGAMLYYELAEPIIEDIDPIPQLEAINVEAGGEVSFIDHSDMDFPIPTTHEWVVRNSEV